MMRTTSHDLLKRLVKASILGASVISPLAMILGTLLAFGETAVELWNLRSGSIDLYHGVPEVFWIVAALVGTSCSIYCFGLLIAYKCVNLLQETQRFKAERYAAIDRVAGSAAETATSQSSGGGIIGGGVKPYVPQETRLKKDADEPTTSHRKASSGDETP